MRTEKGLHVELLQEKCDITLSSTTSVFIVNISINKINLLRLYQISTCRHSQFSYTPGLLVDNNDKLYVIHVRRELRHGEISDSNSGFLHRYQYFVFSCFARNTNNKLLASSAIQKHMKKECGINANKTFRKTFSWNFKSTLGSILPLKSQ